MSFVKTWALAAVVALLLALVRARAVVEGDSMRPTLEPGERVLMVPVRWPWRGPRTGDVVVLRDPRRPSRELVKRVAALDGPLVTVRGDAAASTDSRQFGPVPAACLRGRVIYRYWPPDRAGWIPEAGSGPPATPPAARDVTPAGR